MRATDIIRGVLDLLDQVDGHDHIEQEVEVPDETGEQTSRFKQILAQLISRDVDTQYSNSPCEIVSDVDSVTTDAGGGLNGSKHPDDIRVKDPRAYE